METHHFIQLHKDDNVRHLALQKSKYPSVDMPAAMVQIAGYQRIKNKIPTFAANEQVLYPPTLSLEQCSSEATARYKASLLSGGECLVDLTGGFGIDCFFLSERFQQTHYVEQNEALCHVAAHNFRVLGKAQIAVHCTDGTRYLEQMPHATCIFVDPARRNAKGNKIAQLWECEPDITQLQTLLLHKADTVLVKLSPMIDITHTLQQLPNTEAIHVVSVHNECKEVLFVLQKSPSHPTPHIHAVNIHRTIVQHFCFTKEQEQTHVVPYANGLKKYLYEPNASVLKAGAFKTIGASFELDKLDPNTHLYTSDTLHTHFCGRIFEIIQAFGMQKSSLKELTSTVSKANISVRNFPKTPEQLRKQLKITDGGDIYLFATTYQANKHVILMCRKA